VQEIQAQVRAWGRDAKVPRRLDVFPTLEALKENDLNDLFRD
jgi:hypothetical protein